MAYSTATSVVEYGKGVEMDIQLTLNSEAKSHLDIVREKVSYYGEEHVNIADLLTLIIGRSTNTESCYNLSSLPVREIFNLTQGDIQDLGFSKVIGERLHAAILLAKKLNKLSLPETVTVRSPEDAAKYLMYTRHYDQEVFTVLTLDTKNNITSKKEVFKGSLNASIVHPRECFNFALQKNAASIIVSHNHRATRS